MNHIQEVLGKVVLSKSFRDELKGAIDNGTVEDFLKNKGYNLDQSHVDGLKNVDTDALHDASVKDLPNELMSKVGVDPQW